MLHKKQINKLIGAVDRDGMTLIPLKLYFNERGRAKLLLAVAKGKKLHDKREARRSATGAARRAACCGREAEGEWQRDKGRMGVANGEEKKVIIFLPVRHALSLRHY